jgi:hypothetical protein
MLFMRPESSRHEPARSSASGRSFAYGGYAWLRHLTDRSTSGRSWMRRRLFSAASPAASPNRASAPHAKRSAGVNARLAASLSRWRLGY